MPSEASTTRPNSLAVPASKPASGLISVDVLFEPSGLISFGVLLKPTSSAKTVEELSAATTWPYL
jgi:hypothetical protein